MNKFDLTGNHDELTRKKNEKNTTEWITTSQQNIPYVGPRICPIG